MRRSEGFGGRDKEAQFVRVGSYGITHLRGLCDSFSGKEVRKGVERKKPNSGGNICIMGY